MTQPMKPDYPQYGNSHQTTDTAAETRAAANTNKAAGATDSDSDAIVARPVCLNHVALVVDSLEEQTRFYTSAVGLKASRKVDMGNHVIQYLESEHQDLIELIEYRDGRRQPRAFEQEARHHIAFSVSNIEQVAQRVTLLGGKVIASLVFAKQLGFYSIMVEDPEGFRVELVEYPALD
ncbi:VOC family protein [Bifidobacterium tibiigranuli]|jgi:predicted enzyme related to lactoylglutathione lyase|nr:VOC family protein [Bifidobacterium tibiigranuli]MCH3975744.1 VOC family protein [Bifidobacterium tibiigranuli]MCH4203029.1 VOC family protein [Bifidobacterium tibiigranuli]